MKTKFLIILLLLLFTSCKTTELVIDTNATKDKELDFSKLSIDFEPTNGEATVKFINVIRDDYYLNLVNNSMFYDSEYPLGSFIFIEENFSTTFNGSITIEVKLRAKKPGNDSVRENIEDILSKFIEKKVQVGSEYSFKHGFSDIILVLNDSKKYDYKNGNASRILYNDKTKQTALIFNIVNKPIKFRANKKS